MNTNLIFNELVSWSGLRQTEIAKLTGVAKQHISGYTKELNLSENRLHYLAEKIGYKIIIEKDIRFQHGVKFRFDKLKTREALAAKIDEYFAGVYGTINLPHPTDEFELDCIMCSHYRVCKLRIDQNTKTAAEFCSKFVQK